MSQKRYRLLGRHLQWPEKEKNALKRSRGQNEAQANVPELSQTLRRTLLHSAEMALSHSILTVIPTESKEVTQSRARQGSYNQMIYRCVVRTILHKT